jgi:arylsulfatase A-like enzyme
LVPRSNLNLNPELQCTIDHQAVHGPLEAPQKYLDMCDGISEHDRHIFCGMIQALDEGIGNITAALKARGLLDNTIIAFTTDNGGQNGVGGNNWYSPNPASNSLSDHHYHHHHHRH